MANRKRVNVPPRAAAGTSGATGNGASAARPRPGAKPKLGQHFLADRSAAERIVSALGDVSQRTVIEIGPGEGVLTSLIATRARRVIAIELDRVLAAQLRMKFAQQENVEIIEGDVLAIDVSTLLGPKPGLTRPGLAQEPERADLIGNLPYYITSDILLRLFSVHRWLQTMVVMVQREVAERLAASPGSRDYGLLTATARLYCRVEKLFTLPPEAFNPPPKVHSSVLRLSIAPQLEHLGVPDAEFQDFLRLSFGQKRKTLWNNLKSSYDTQSLTQALRRAGVQPSVRAEALSLEKMAALYRALPQPTGGA
jgi:16S rRNA (adenine1518-N6/adenine1519-N6)-dimethyltransferase